MGLGGISVWQLAIVLAIVVLIFGTKKIGTLGHDLGDFVKGLRSAGEDLEGIEEDLKRPPEDTQ